jgi:acyl-CoA thioester hydrolase
VSERWPVERLDPTSYLEPGVDLPVLYGDLDTVGHLNNVSFGRFFEQARFLAHRAIGLPAVMHDEGSGLHVARVSVDYLHEARFGSPLHVRVRGVRLGTSSVVEEQAAWQNGRCVALAEVVMVNVVDGEPAPLSSVMRAALERLLTTGGGRGDGLEGGALLG